MSGDWPLVGREGELSDLRRHLRSLSGDTGGAMVVGDLGVGKTRLVTEAIAACRADGAVVEWVRATEAARDIPLGAFAFLVGADAGLEHRTDVLHLALRRLQDLAEQGRDERSGAVPGTPGFVLAVDDAHLLDEMSVALIHLAITRSAAHVLLSVRSGEPVPPGLTALWKDNLLARLDVAPLQRGEVDTLVLAALGDEVPASVLDRIWQLSQGNPLFVRELLAAAQERRTASAGRDLLVLPSSGQRERLHELVEERLRLLSPGRRQLLEAVALGEQVPVDALTTLAETTDLEALEQQGLIAVVDAGGALVAHVAHPFYGEVLAAGLPEIRRQAVLRQLVDAVAGMELPDRFDRLRLATWRLESGARSEPAQLLDHAREALSRLDPHLAQRLAEGAGGVSRVDAGLVVGQALAGQNRTQAAADVFEQLQPETPEQEAQVALSRSHLAFYQMDQSSEAMALLRQASASLADHPAAWAESQAMLAQLSWLASNYDEARAVSDQVLAEDDVPPTARMRAVGVAATTAATDGRLDDALALLGSDLMDMAHTYRREVPYADLQLRMCRFMALHWAGRVPELDAYTRDRLGLDLDVLPPSVDGIVAGFRGGALLFMGRAADGLLELQRASRAFTEADLFGQQALAEAMRARAALFAGNLAEAEEAVKAADHAYGADPVRSARLLPYIELSRAWVMAGQGRLADAAEACLNLGIVMQALAKPLAVETLHAAVRLGRAADAEAGLEAMSHEVDGPFVYLALRHARVAARGDPDELAEMAEAFDDLGAELVAAEVARAAANAYTRAGRGGSAAAWARRVDELLERCGQPWSPAMPPPARMGEELTVREREVAMLAAAGRTSPQIAAELYLSARTVDTHLSRVYRKLMVSGRHELADALDTIDNR